MVIGCVERRWKKLGKGRNDRTNIDLALRANNIQVVNKKVIIIKPMLCVFGIKKKTLIMPIVPVLAY